MWNLKTEGEKKEKYPKRQTKKESGSGAGVKRVETHA
jgi:hypothetical protein